MKKIIVSLSLLLTVSVVSAFAENPNPDPTQKVLEGFKKEFPAAQYVSWTVQEEFDKVIFVMAGRRVIAYFTKEGDLEGSVRDIFYDQLPLNVMTAVDKRFENRVILNVLEINNAEGTSYKIRMEDKNRTYCIRVRPDGSISEVEKLSK